MFFNYRCRERGGLQSHPSGGMRSKGWLNYVVGCYASSYCHIRRCLVWMSRLPLHLYNQLTWKAENVKFYVYFLQQLRKSVEYKVPFFVFQSKPKLWHFLSVWWTIPLHFTSDTWLSWEFLVIVLCSICLGDTKSLKTLPQSQRWHSGGKAHNSRSLRVTLCTTPHGYLIWGPISQMCPPVL